MGFMPKSAYAESRSKIIAKIVVGFRVNGNCGSVFDADCQFVRYGVPANTNFEEWDIVPSYWHHWIGINEPAIEAYYDSKSDLEISRLLAKRLNELRPGFSTFPYEKSIEDFIEEEFTDEIYKNLEITNWRDLLDGPKGMTYRK